MHVVSYVLSKFVHNDLYGFVYIYIRMGRANYGKVIPEISFHKKTESSFSQTAYVICKISFESTEFKFQFRQILIKNRNLI